MSDGGQQGEATLPLTGVSVLDFTTLLPGPLATLMLAEAGAEVTKVERPGGGDEIRQVPPLLDETMSVRFLLLNRGKQTVTLDLKSDAGRARARELALRADVLVEQFRPGVMQRLGLGYDELARENQGLVYCSITGYGQTGPKASVAAHDLNYQADAGLLSLVTGAGGAPAMPAATFADIAGGSYPAVLNILLALAGRTASGRGAQLDVAMTENLLPFVYWGIGNGLSGRWPEADAELLTGGSPRYDVYPTSDGGAIAVAAIEDRFWEKFCEAIELQAELRDDRRDPEATRRAVAGRLAEHTTAQWQRTLAGRDTCANVVQTVQQAIDDAHVRAREIFGRVTGIPGTEQTLPAMHVPIVPGLRSAEQRRDAPLLDHDVESEERDASR